MTKELTFTIKDEEKKRLTKTFLVYESFELHEHDPVIQKHLTELLNEFKGVVDTVKLKVTMVLV